LKEKILIGVLHWYFPEEIRYLFNLRLEESWGAENLEIRDCLLLSKKTALGWLLVQDRWSTRDFYGNILKNTNLRSLNLSRFKDRNRSKPKESVFRRGYNDKGSLRDPQRSPIYDYKKLRTVSEQILLESLQTQKFQDLLWSIEERLRLEKI
jgi:hypothetical protein